MGSRILGLAVLFVVEAMCATLLFDGQSGPQASGLTAWIRVWGPWMARGAIGFAAIFTAFAWLKHRASLVAPVPENVAFGWLSLNVAAFAGFLWLSPRIFDSSAETAWAALWLALAATVLVSGALAAVPLRHWRNLVSSTGALGIWSALATILALLAIPGVRMLWRPAAKLTFNLVNILLRPFVGDGMVFQPERLRLGTKKFTVIIADECSGLEGIGLLLVFGLVCMILFRKELKFPQCLALFPIGIVTLFMLNAVRITALVLIGHMGARQIALGGFHSQAGWIAFNGVAFGLCLVSQRWPFMWREPILRQKRAETDPTTAFLLPFLAIMGAGILAQAMSGKFEWMYPLRLVAAGTALWMYWPAYRGMFGKPSWGAVIAGVGVFALWLGVDWIQGVPASPMPAPLREAAQPLAVAWIVLHAIASVVTVPIAEELAFRGFAMRRLVREDFERVPLGQFSWFPVLASSVLFGLLHGSRWPAGILAGLAYAWAATRKGNLTDAALAHAITNGLIVLTVLGYGQWQLW